LKSKICGESGEIFTFLIKTDKNAQNFQKTKLKKKRGGG
jgi:hypothetical protein